MANPKCWQAKAIREMVILYMENIFDYHHPDSEWCSAYVSELYITAYTYRDAAKILARHWKDSRKEKR